MGHIPLADMAYLKRRRGKRRSGYRWYVRIVVPTDLQELLGSKAIERALNTSDLKEAQRRKHAVVDEILTSFDRARQHKITSADIEHEAQQFLRERLAAIQKRPGNTFEESKDYFGRDIPAGGEIALLELYQLLEDEDWPDSIEREADKIARRYGTSFTAEQRQECCHALLRAEIQAVSRAMAAHNSEFVTPISVLNARAIDPITAEVQLPNRLPSRKGKGLRIKEATVAYIAHQTRNGDNTWTEQTRGQVETTLRLFADFTRDAPIETVTRREVAEFLAAIAKLDPLYGRRSSEKELTLNTLLKNYPARDGKGLRSKTLKRHGSVIAGIFDWALDTGKIEGSNPAKGHHRSLSKDYSETGDCRRSFTTAELEKLFRGPIFTVEWTQRVQPKEHTHETTLAWLIPIALFSGMRLDEICGMRVEDILEEKGIQFFNVTSYEGRRLKTEAARRHVPIHSELILLGFGEYLAHVKQRNYQHLFPALKPGGPDKKRSWYISKRFTEYRRSVGVSDAGTVFHSFRKNAATALERARVPENEAVQILGHKKMTMSYGLYSGGIDLPQLRKVVEAIKYPELDLTPLHGEARHVSDVP